MTLDRPPGNQRNRRLMRVDTTGASQVVLTLAPVGRDPDVAVSVLRTAGIVAQLCENVSERENSVGALMLTEESLAPINHKPHL
jgi:hypothetical protein